MKKQLSQVGKAELTILQHIIDHHPVTVREVAAHMATTTGQARTTVLTFMERLRDKGLLRRKKVQGVNQYSPAISKRDLMNSLVREFVEGVLGGSVSPFFSYLSDDSKLSESELKELQALAKTLPKSK